MKAQVQSVWCLGLRAYEGRIGEVIREIPAPFWREYGTNRYDGILLRFLTGEEIMFSRYELSEDDPDQHVSPRDPSPGIRG